MPTLDYLMRPCENRKCILNVLVIYCCLTSYSKTQWFKTTVNIFHLQQFLKVRNEEWFSWAFLARDPWVCSQMWAVTIVTEACWGGGCTSSMAQVGSSPWGPLHRAAFMPSQHAAGSPRVSSGRDLTEATLTFLILTISHCHFYHVALVTHRQGHPNPDSLWEGDRWGHDTRRQGSLGSSWRPLHLITICDGSTDTFFLEASKASDWDDVEGSQHHHS